jgi:hypothetical protein
MTTPAEIVRGVVRAERSIHELEALGAEFHATSVTRSWTTPPDFPLIEVSLADIATGLLNSSRVDSPGEWAFTVRAIDLDVADADSPDGETLLDTVWDMAFGNQIDQAALDLATRLVESAGNVI